MEQSEHEELELFMNYLKLEYKLENTWMQSYKNERKT